MMGGSANNMINITATNTTSCGGANDGGAPAGPCGACKFLRRKCAKGCVFAPHFDPEGGAVHFAAVHRVFGASNASKLLQRVPPHRRAHAVLALCYEAHARLRDPVYGCVAHIFALQQQVVDLETEIALIHAQLTAVHSNHQTSAACNRNQQNQPAAPSSAEARPPMQPSHFMVACPSSPTSATSSLSAVFDPNLHPYSPPQPQPPPPSVTTAADYMQQERDADQDVDQAVAYLFNYKFH